MSPAVRIQVMQSKYYHECDQVIILNEFDIDYESVPSEWKVVEITGSSDLRKFLTYTNLLNKELIEKTLREDFEAENPLEFMVAKGLFLWYSGITYLIVYALNVAPIH